MQEGDRVGPVQRPRFGPIRAMPPNEVLSALSGAVPETGWTYERFGVDGGFPNGGIWKVCADRAHGAGPSTAWVKRTGPAYLGSFPAWRCWTDPDDPQWWGREAAFYGSELATSGWSGGVRAARCYLIDDHDDARDLWLEAVRTPTFSLESCVAAARGLARWQVAWQNAGHAWLSEDWIPTHVGRQAMDNARTLAHPAWSLAIERGLDPTLRTVVETRLTDPIEVRERLREFPHVPTHFDFHASNIGTVGEEVVIIDWAYVGWGPIGHDVGHLALNLDPDASVEPGEAWRTIRVAYCEALAQAGWGGDPAVIERSMEVSNALRLGWAIDHLLDHAEQLPDAEFAAAAASLQHFATLRRE